MEHVTIRLRRTLCSSFRLMQGRRVLSFISTRAPRVLLTTMAGTSKGGGLCNTLEVMRDQAAEPFEIQTGSAWPPRTGSKVYHHSLTAAVIDSRDFLAAKRRAETEVMVPLGPKVAITGGYECHDHRAIWAALDRVQAKHPSMVLLHGGGQGRRTDRCLLGRCSQGAAGRLQTGLHPV